MVSVTYAEYTFTDMTTSYDCTTGTWADYASDAYVSGTELVIEEDLVDGDVCAHSIFMMYLDGQTSGGVTIDATTQLFTIYSDNSVVTAASAFFVAGVAAMFF